MTADDQKMLEDEFSKILDEIKSDREKFWNSLTKEQQLKAFCAVVDRIYRCEKMGKSYRGILYGEFGFGKEAYTQAMDAGFMYLHNSFYDQEMEYNLLLTFAKALDIPDAEKIVKKYIGDFDHV